MLIGTELPGALVHLTLASAHVRGEPPLSILLIGEPESGKTSIVLEACSHLKDLSSVALLTDITYMGIVGILRRPEIRHIVLNDLTAIGAHKPTVSRMTISLLNAMTEEGVKDIRIGPLVEDFSGKGRRGIIACLTLDLAKDERHWWNKIGFTSRMLPFCFSHSAALQIKIKSHIIGQFRVEASNHKKVRFPKRRIIVPPEHARAIRQIAEMKTDQLRSENTKEIGYRRLKQFILVCQSRALLAKRNKVSRPDIDFLRQLQPHISYTRPHPI